MTAARTTTREGGVTDPQGRGVTTAVAWGLALLFIVLFGLILWMDARMFAVHLPDQGSLAWLGLHGVWLGPFVVFAVVGAVIASRRPRHPVGWLLLAAPLAAGFGEAGRTYAALAIGTATNGPPTLAAALKAPSGPVTVTGIVLGLVFIPLIFPTGRLPSRRWRVVPWAAGAFLVTFLINSVLSPRVSYSLALPDQDGQVQLYDVANPLSPDGIPEVVSAVPPGASTILLPAFIIVAGAAVVVRFRRSEGVERQQMKWFAYAAALVAVAAISQVVSAALTVNPGGMVALLLVGGLSAYPVAMGVAVLRYRLYEIDRLISRTVSYGLIVAVLAGVYVAGIVGLGAAVSALTGRGESDLVVAVSTLVAAGLFRPVRARIQSGVDRRFNRTGYEARRAVEAFTRDVRDEVDLEQIRRRVVETAVVATQPTHASVWLPDVERSS